jgi:zinc protease
MTASPQTPPRARKPRSLPRSRSSFLCLLLLGCAGTQPGASPAAAPSGPSLIALPPAARDTVSFRIHFRSGAADDPRGKEGITALAAKLMAEGGTERLSAAELQTALYPLAAELKVQVDKENTVFVGRCPKAALDRFLPIFTEVVRRPRFDAAELERLRAEAIDRIGKTLRTENDEELGKEALGLMLYGGHPYGHPTTGTVQGLKAVTLPELRAHAAKVFGRSRLTVAVAGGYPSGLPEQVDKMMEALPPGVPPAAIPPPKPEGPRYLLVEKPGLPTAISMGLTWPVKRGHPDFIPLVVAVSALGEHRQGGAFRLFRELREIRGLNYGDYAYPEFFRQAGGSAAPEVNVGRSHQELSVWIRPVEPAHRLFAIRAALHELDKWVRQGLTAEELEQVKGFLSGYTLNFEQTDLRRLGYAIDDRFYGLDGSYLASLRKRIQGLTLEEVNGAIKKHVDLSRLKVAVATHDAAKLRKEMLAGTPSPITYPVPKPDAVLTADKVIERFALGIEGETDVKVVPVTQLFER